MGMLTVVLEQELLQEFKEWCVEKGVTMSDTLRGFITECLQQKLPEIKTANVEVLVAWNGKQIELPQPCKVEGNTLSVPNDTRDEELLLLGSLLPQYVVNSDNDWKTSRKMKVI